MKIKLPHILLAWAIANFLPHIVVFVLSGKIYYQLSLEWAIISESSIMLLNLFLPIIFLRYFTNQKESVADYLGWKWRGFGVIGIGFIGLILYFLILIITQSTLGNPISTPGWNLNSPFKIVAILILLLVLTAACEETMFRGFLQTAMTREYGNCVGIVIPALLFGLRHLPMDLYAGFSQNASISAWVCRMLQLYLGGILFGVFRFWGKSTWASWFIHEMVLIFIIILAVSTIF